MVAVEVDDTEAKPVSQAPRSGGLDATLLFLTGFAMAAAGLLLAAAPNISWQLTKVMRGLAALGLDTGSLFTGGMALVGLGMVARSVASLGSRGDQESDSALVLEQLGTDLAQTRASLSRLDRRISGLAKAVQEESAKPAPAMTQSPPEEGGTENTDAIWRMAASLDQLGARLERGLDEQVKGLASSLDKQVQSLSGRLDGQVDGLTGRLEELAKTFGGHGSMHAAPATPAQAPAPEAPSPHAHTQQPSSTPEPPPATPSQGTDATRPEGRTADVLNELDDIEFLSDASGDGERERPKSFGEHPSAVFGDAVASEETSEGEPTPRGPLPSGGGAAPQQGEEVQSSQERTDLDKLLPDDRIDDSIGRARGA
jgi:hypothetical protein